MVSMREENKYWEMEIDLNKKCEEVRKAQINALENEKKLLLFSQHKKESSMYRWAFAKGVYHAVSVFCIFYFVCHELSKYG